MVVEEECGEFYQTMVNEMEKEVEAKLNTEAQNKARQINSVIES